MRTGFTRGLQTAFATAAVIAVAACGSSSKSSSSKSSSSTTTGGSTAVNLTADSFVLDFSAMQQLKSLAAQGRGKIGVLLPDTTTSARYETFDRPYLAKAFKAAGLSDSDFKIDNAQGSTSTMQTQAEADITDGASVLLVDAIDSGSGAAIEANAVSKGLKVIDYDRLVQGGPADRVYVSFDNVGVGKLIGQGFVDCVANWKVTKPNVLIMNGDPTDNNASLFSQGYHSVLDPLFQSGKYVKAAEPAGTWTPSVAQTTFDQQYTAHKNINSAVTPNDDNANAVIASLQRLKIPAKTFPTTGQDASASGLQNILKNYQCGTVYKPIYKEAQAAAAVALYLRARQTPPASLVANKATDPSTKKDVASVFLKPTWVTTQNMNDTVVHDQAIKVSDLCTPQLQKACTDAGIK